eukprot:1051443-Rhodomonas_salina.3
MCGTDTAMVPYGTAGMRSTDIPYARGTTSVTLEFSTFETEECCDKVPAYALATRCPVLRHRPLVPRSESFQAQLRSVGTAKLNTRNRFSGVSHSRARTEVCYAPRYSFRTRTNPWVGWYQLVLTRAYAATRDSE